MHLFYLQAHPFIDNSFVRELAFSAYRNLLPLISTDKSTKTFWRIGHFAGWNMRSSPINTGISEVSNVSDAKFAVKNAL